MQAERLVVFKYEDQGVATLEDGLYTLEEKLKDPGHGRQAGKLRQGLDEGLGLGRRASRTRRSKIVLDNDATGAQTEKHQKQMMSEIDKLIEGRDGPGSLDPAAYERTVGNADQRQVRSGHHQEAGRCVDPRGLGEGRPLTTSASGNEGTLALPKPFSAQCQAD